MSRNAIIAVGGTGQLVLHYYVQLFQIGMIPDAFQAVVVDSDALLPSLEKISQFWNAVRLAHPDPTQVPELQYFPVAQNLRGLVQQAVVGADLPAVPRIHPAEAFFDSTSLQQGVTEGLYARPALSAVLQTDWDRFPLAALTGLQRVLVVGSLIGGTGGGLIAPMLSQVAMRIRSAATAQQPRLRGLFFGEYFKLEGDSPVSDASQRYLSNKLMVARSLKELAPPELEHFTFIEPSTPKRRVLTDERNPVHLSWPEETDAIWMGVSALEELRTNRTWPNSDEFKDKEKPSFPLRDLLRDRTELQQSLGVASALALRKVLQRIPGEPWMSRFYDRPLPRLLAGAYGVARRTPKLGFRGPRDLARLVQEKYTEHWNQVGTVFPDVGGKIGNPAAVRAIPWAELKTEVPDLASSRETLAGATSALILHCALRGGAA